MSKDDNSLAHTRWNCKYHIIFTTKYRRKNIYGELKQDIGRILRRLCELKEVEIIEAHAISDHIHMLVKIPPKMSVSRFMGYLKGQSAVIIHERHTNLKYNYGNRSFWASGYYAIMVSLNQKTIQKHIREQECEDRLNDSISKKEHIDPFKHSQSKNRNNAVMVGSVLLLPFGVWVMPLLELIKSHQHSWWIISP